MNKETLFACQRVRGADGPVRIRKQMAHEDECYCGHRHLCPEPEKPWSFYWKQSYYGRTLFTFRTFREACNFAREIFTDGSRWLHPRSN